MVGKFLVYDVSIVHMVSSAWSVAWNITCGRLGKYRTNHLTKNWEISLLTAVL